MAIWKKEDWKKIYGDGVCRAGLRLRPDCGVHPEVKRACKDFCRWLRSEYTFPVRVPIYLKAYKKLRTTDGDLAFGTFFEPDDRNDEPYIRIAVGDYPELLRKYGRDNALATILHTLAHELAHYFQWINAVTLTPTGAERQAGKEAAYIMDLYRQTREHP